MKTVRVELEERSYPIYIGEMLIDRGELFAPHIRGQQVMVVTNDTVGPLYLDRLLTTLRPYEAYTTVLPDGEEHKNLRVLETIYDALLEVPCDRQTTVIALGGGVVGDIAGLAAATYQRGVAFIQVPTTLLAQVDSSVGGKTGVNHPRGKNMIGAFHQPAAVVIDIKTLNTLDDRELRAGIAEVIKYGIIRDAIFFEWLEENIERLLARDAQSLSFAIERSCRNKAAVVAADERETGQRALLNLGHTFGHAIETALGYGKWLHGEAVAAGMVMAADLSRRLGDLPEAEFDRIRDLVVRAGLPANPPREVTAEQFLHHMAVDKKVSQGVIRLVLLRGIGESYVSAQYPAQALRDTLHHFEAAA